MILVCEVNFTKAERCYVQGTFTYINHQWVGDADKTQYYNYTVDVHMDTHNATISLFSSNSDKFRPAIMKYTNPDDNTIKYYFALILLKGHNWNKVYFDGMSNVNILNEHTVFSGSTLPSGYEIYQESSQMQKLNLVSGYIGNGTNSYSYADIKALEDRISTLENV